MATTKSADFSYLPLNVFTHSFTAWPVCLCYAGATYQTGGKYYAKFIFLHPIMFMKLLSEQFLPNPLSMMSQNKSNIFLVERGRYCRNIVTKTVKKANK